MKGYEHIRLPYTYISFQEQIMFVHLQSILISKLYDFNEILYEEYFWWAFRLVWKMLIQSHQWIISQLKLTNYSQL
jgi:hypothetical protein